MSDDDAEKIATRKGDTGTEIGTGGRVSEEDTGVTPEGVPGSDQTVRYPTRGRLGEAVDLATGGRVGEEETHIAVDEAPDIPVSHPRVKRVEDLDRWKFKLFDVMLRRPGKDEISLLDQGVLMRVGDITKEFEQDYGQFAVSSVAINVSNLNGFLDIGKPNGYFEGLDKSEIVEARIILKDTGESVFKGILAQKEEDFDIDTDEGVLELEGELKRHENLSAGMMWQDDDPDDPHRFKSISAVVEKCRELMNIDPGRTVIEKPVLTGDDYSFSYYNRINKDEVVNSIAVDENGIVYQCTDHKIYSFDPLTEETKELYAISDSAELSKLIYYNDYLFFTFKDIDQTYLIKICRIKTDGTNFQYIGESSVIPEITERISKTLSYSIGDGMANSSHYNYYPFTSYVFELIGLHTDRHQLLSAYQSLELNDYTYVDFEYLDQQESECLDWNGDKTTVPNKEKSIRIFRNRYQTIKIMDEDKEVLIQDYVGTLPTYLPPGSYSFVSLPCESDLPDGTGISYANGNPAYVYKDYSPWEAPKPFKIFYETRSRFDMNICSGVLFYTYIENSGTSLWKLNLSTLETEEVGTLVGGYIYRSGNDPMPLAVDGNNLIIGNILQSNNIGQLRVDSYVDIFYDGGILIETDKKFFIKEVAKLNSDFIAILEPKEYPRLLETKYNIGFQEATDWTSFDNWMAQDYPGSPPFYINFSLGFRADLLSLTGSQWYFPIIHPPGGYVYIYLSGNIEESEDNLDILNCFAKSDSINFLNSGDVYDSIASKISELTYENMQNIFVINRSRIDILLPTKTLSNNLKIYRDMGKLPARCKVKTSSGLELENYTLVEDEEFEVPVCGIVERSEPAKLKNKDVYRDSSFKIELESGVEIPTTDYTIREYMGTDKNETWIYFGPIYQGKKVLITYKYVDPEKTYSGFVLAHNKVYFTESKTNRLISYDGIEFKEEGLTYNETQPDYSVRTLTEQIKSSETGISSNLVYDSVNDRIYGVTSPNNCVLFQYAKDIALYIPDCKFLGKNVLQVLGECARICNFVVYMDDEGILYFVPRDYNTRNFILTEEDIFSINSRMAAYEFGETYEKITVRFDGGEVVLGEGMLIYSSGSEYISSRGWATVLANDLQDYFSTNPQIFTIVQKFVTGIRPLDMVLPIVTEKHIGSMAIVQRVRIDQENQKVEITAREKK